MKNILIALALGVGGFWAYNKYKKNSAIGYNPNQSGSNTVNPSKAIATSQYPFKAPQAPRVDNSNQPWYFGYRDFTGGPANSYPAASQIPAVANASASVISSLSDLFGNDSENPTGYTSDDIGSSNGVGPDSQTGYDLPQLTMPDNPFGALDTGGDPGFDTYFAPDGSSDPSSSVA